MDVKICIKASIMESTSVVFFFFLNQNVLLFISPCSLSLQGKEMDFGEKIRKIESYFFVEMIFLLAFYS